MHPVGREGRAIKGNEEKTINAAKPINEAKHMTQIITRLQDYLKEHPATYYEPVESLLDLIYNFYTETNPTAPKETAAGRAAKQMDKDLAEWLKGIEGMDRMVIDYGINIPLWEDIMNHVGSVNYGWERTAFEEGMKVGIRLMMEVYSL